jgi:hypothetical protein
MESRPVQITFGLLLAVVALGHLIRLVNAWIAATEDYRDALEIQTMQGVANWQMFAESLSEEDEEELGPEFN